MKVSDFVTGAGRKDLGEGELLRSVTLPARALASRTAFRQASLYGLGRSGVLVIGVLDPVDGPLGAKSMSESPFNPVAPAFANALREATGNQVHRTAADPRPGVAGAPRGGPVAAAVRVPRQR